MKGSAAVAAVVLVGVFAAAAPPPAAADAVVCTRLADAELLDCAGSDAALCPDACAATGARRRAQESSMSSGTVSLPGNWDTNGDGRVTQAEVDAAVARTTGGAASASTVSAGFRASCATLLELDEGCAHDLSLADPGLAPQTRVSDLCPEECSGHMGCMRCALDVSFLASEDRDGLGDTSTRDGQVQLEGDACVDGGGMATAAGGARIAMTTQYAQEGEFSIALWMLPHAMEIWMPGASRDADEILFHHASAAGGGGITVALGRGAWADTLTLEVNVGGRRSLSNPTGSGAFTLSSFAVDAFQDEVPRWTHIAVTVSSAGIVAHIDGQLRSPLSQSSGIGDDFSCVDPIFAGSTRHYDTIVPLPLSSEDRAIVITTRMNKNAFIGLFADTEGSEQVYTISLGVSGNQLSTISDSSGAKHCDQCFGAAELGTLNTPDLLSESEDRTFWMTANQGLILVGVGDAVGQNELMRWQDPDFYDHPEPRFVGIMSGWGGEGLITFCGSGWGSPEDLEQLPEDHGWNLQLSDQATVGIDGGGWPRFRGSVSMLQLFPSALTESDVECVFQSGRRLVHSGRMSQSSASNCRDHVVTTGCTSQVAANSPNALGIVPPTVDDGSCTYEPQPSVSGDAGLLTLSATNAWQSVSLSGSYLKPVVIVGVVTRESTTQAVVRVRNLRMSTDGTWSLELRVELKSCHFAQPPGSLEHVSFLVVDGGVSAEGWQAGITRVHDQEWHRVSLLPGWESSVEPVVLSHVQTFDDRIGLVTTHHHHESGGLHGSANTAFFVQARGNGIWCPDGAFLAEYFDNLELSGSPVAVDCEATVPNWHWHSTSSGVPFAMAAADSQHPLFFSIRWSTRLDAGQGGDFVFSSTANQGSRIIVDGVVLVDNWSECCDQFDSEPVTLSGTHELVYEYRSAYENREEFVPIDSYAELSWLVHGHWYGAADEALSNFTSAARNELFADIGWFACPGRSDSTIHGLEFQTGFTNSVSDLVVNVRFSPAFSAPPHVFASITSLSDLSTHLRLLTAGQRTATVAVEYDSCSPVFAPSAASLGWVALSTNGGENASVSQLQTLWTDTSALLSIGRSLRLPTYFNWRNNSDPCRDRWGGIECRSGEDGIPRVIVLDVHNIDLNGQDIPWAAIGQMDALEVGWL